MAKKQEKKKEKKVHIESPQVWASTKNNMIWIVALLVVVWGIVAYLFSPKSPFQGLHEMINPPASVLSYIPAVFDQVLVLDVDAELRDVALMSNDLEDRESFLWLLNTLEEVVVYQWSTPTEIFNVLIMKWNEQFVIEDIVSLWLLVDDENYGSKKLWESIWAYGSDAWISYLEQWLAEKAMDDDSFRVFDRARRAWDYNVWFFSRPVVEGQTNPIAQQFAQRLEFTYLLSHINQTDPGGRLTMQFADGTLESWSKDFVPKIVNRLADHPWFFVELSDVFSIIWIDPSQAALLAPSLLAQVGAAQDLQQTDINTLIAWLQGNISIILTPSQLSPVQLGGHLVFDDPAMFSALKKLTPALKWIVDIITWWAELMQLDETVTDTEVIYSVTSWTGDLALSFPLVQLSKNPDNTTLSILTQSPLEYTSNSKIDQPALADTTRMWFGWDAWLLQQNFLQAQIGQGETTAQQLFQTWSIQWVVDLLPRDQQVHIEFFTVE